MIGMNINALDLNIILSHTNQHIVFGLPFAKIIVQADERLWVF